MIEAVQLFKCKGKKVFATWTDISTGDVWDGSSMVASTKANLILGATVGTENAAGTGLFRFTVPATVSALKYSVQLWLFAGGSPVIGDLSGKEVASGVSTDVSIAIEGSSTSTTDAPPNASGRYTTEGF